MRKSIPTILETKQLPHFAYLERDKITVPVTAEDFDTAVKQIKAAKLVGFDTESKPVFEKGAVNGGPHVVQFATQDRAYIFQLSNVERHNPLVYLLAADDIKKVGFDLASDRKLLLKKFGVSPRSFVDLCPMFKRRGYRNTVGVRAAVAILFNQQFYKSKHTTMSDWSNPLLSETQISCAANDAYGALCVYFKILSDAEIVA
ncbi:MAG TPA: 3'-5' exonuclease [Cellvibrio sp.]|nr:3'-5' exonuclease [Cellvibrio sp.]